MIHGHPVKYRAENLAEACHGFLKKFLELIKHGAAVLTVRFHLPPAVSLRSIGPSAKGAGPSRAEAPRMAARGVEPALSRVSNRHLHPRPAGADRGSAGHVMCRRQFDTRG
jgi:hypothetical protein